MKKIISLFLLWGLLVAPGLVFASEEPILQKESVESEIAGVQRTYKGQLAEYREAEDQFYIAKGQFVKLNTLASLEVAVQDARQAMLLRDQVFLTYLKLTQLQVLESTGMNLEEKNLILEDNKELERSFQAHYDQVQKAVDRVAIDLAADDFVLLSAPISAYSDAVSSLLKISRLQTIYDRSLTVVGKTKPVVGEGEASLKVNEALRAHGEISALADEIAFNLENGWLQLKEGREKNKLTDLSRPLSGVFSDLSQLLLFLEEIVIKK